MPRRPQERGHAWRGAWGSKEVGVRVLGGTNVQVFDADHGLPAPTRRARLSARLRTWCRVQLNSPRDDSKETT